MNENKKIILNLDDFKKYIDTWNYLSTIIEKPL